MIKNSFTPDANLSALGTYNSPTFGPVTSRLNVHVIVSDPVGSAGLSLLTSIDGTNWDVARDPNGVALLEIALNKSKLYQFEVFGRLFMLHGTSDGTSGTLDKILIYHD